MKVQVQSVHFTADGKLLEFINKKLSKLDQFFDRILDAEVNLKLENTGQVRDKIAEVRLNVPGATIMTKEVNKTFEASIDEAVDSLKRQLIRHKERVQARRPRSA
jgi:putative sigma-54 modulation protein